MKRYDVATEEVEKRIGTIRSKFHTELEEATIGALFVSDPEEAKPVLTHRGYPAAAMVRIISARDRAAGQPDAQMIIDLAIWTSLSPKQRDALIDHELQHLELQRDQSGAPLYDVQDRPRLAIRKHDWQLGWFDAVAQRHGEHSLEVMEARRLLDAASQLYFDFGPSEAAA